MDPLIEFNLPIHGLKSGLHRFDFQIGQSFFDRFENSLVQEGQFSVAIDLDRRPDMLTLLFHVKGTMHTACDRCLEMMDLPVSGAHQLLVKFGGDSREEDEILYLPAGTHELNIAPYIYEAISLSLPLIKAHGTGDAPGSCDPDMLQYFGDEPDDDSPDTPNPLWDALKGLKDN